MLYSVFNWRSGQYKYFRGTGEERGVRPKPRRLFDGPASRGVPIEEALPLVPSGSVFLGSGMQARGRVAVENGDTSTAEGLGPGAAAAGLGADGTENTLATHPWWTLGLWLGAFAVGTKLAYWLGDAAAKKVR